MDGTLFFSEKDRYLFWISGIIKNTNNVEEIIREIKAGCKEFSKIADVSKESVCTIVVTESTQYKNMRVFYVKTLEVPEEATRLSAKTWTMTKFLSI